MSSYPFSGTLGTLFQLFMTIGILCDYALSYFNSYIILCNTVTTISAIFLVCLIFIQESPTYFMLKKRKEAAGHSLKKLRGKDYDVEAELNKLQAQLQNATAQVFSWKYIFRKANAKALVISIGLMVSAKARTYFWRENVGIPEQNLRKIDENLKKI